MPAGGAQQSCESAIDTIIIMATILRAINFTDDRSYALIFV
ncbi:MULTISPECIES: hypothetical protein [unclassified Tychonema]|nr:MULTISPECIES: hypothetical protein [unclassified Tychonema]